MYDHYTACTDNSNNKEKSKIIKHYVPRNFSKCFTCINLLNSYNNLLRLILLHGPFYSNKVSHNNLLPDQTNIASGGARTGIDIATKGHELHFEIQN